MINFSAYCPCGLVQGDEDQWKTHVRTCPKLQELTEVGAVEMRYPDLAPVKQEEQPLLQEHGFRTWSLPRYAKKDNGNLVVDEGTYAESLPVYVARVKAADEATRAKTLDKISKSEEAQKALVALLQCTDVGEHASAIAEFANNI